MRKRPIILLGGLILVLSVLLIFGIRNTKDRDLRVEEYFPNRTMTKEFSGGYEKEGFSRAVEKVDHHMVQINQWDTGTDLFQVYQITENEIRLIYSEEGDSLSGKYNDETASNADETILKAPLKAGTGWSSSRGGTYEITGVNVKTFTRVGMFYTVEVTYKKGSFLSKSYYARNLGLVKRITQGAGSDSLIRLKYGDM